MNKLLCTAVLAAALTPGWASAADDITRCGSITGKALGDLWAHIYNDAASLCSHQTDGVFPAPKWGTSEDHYHAFNHPLATAADKYGAEACVTPDNLDNLNFSWYRDQVIQLAQQFCPDEVSSN